RLALGEPRYREACGKRQSNASESTPRGTTAGRSLDWASVSTVRSVTSMPTLSPSPRLGDSCACSARHARNTSSAYARYPSISVDCDTSAAERCGAWPSTRTATSATSYARFRTGRSTALPRKRSRSVPRTCERDQPLQALRHASGGLPNITLQRPGGLALLARRPPSAAPRGDGESEQGP